MVDSDRRNHRLFWNQDRDKSRANRSCRNVEKIKKMSVNVNENVAY